MKSFTLQNPGPSSDPTATVASAAWHPITAPSFSFAFQEITTRLPGRGRSNLDVATLTEVLRETEQHHGEYELTVDSTTDELVACSVDVGDDQVCAPGREDTREGGPSG